MPESRILIGAMSGTSADGVDVAAVRLPVALLGRHHVPYPPELRRLIFGCRATGVIALADLAVMGRSITLAYADAVNQLLANLRLTPADVAAIAAHGQTLFHGPPDTIQWLDPSLLADRTGIAVVSDFRRADCAAGGQGAPLVPFADHQLFTHPTRQRLLLNLGGIANVTFLPAGGSIDDLIAFDTGPANCVLDHLIRQAGGTVDVGGALTAKGKPDMSVVATLLAEPFFAKPPPRSTDGPAMIAMFERLALRDDLSNRLATAAAWAVDAISGSIRFLPNPPDELIVSGGGVHNAAVMSRLAASFPTATIQTSDAFGIPAEAKEAIAFALLGAATLEGLPSNVPAATGAARRVVLGSIKPGRK